VVRLASTLDLLCVLQVANLGGPADGVGEDEDASHELVEGVMEPVTMYFLW